MVLMMMMMMIMGEKLSNKKALTKVNNYHRERSSLKDEKFLRK